MLQRKTFVTVVSAAVYILYMLLFAHMWAQGWSAPAFSELILFSCWIWNLVSMTISHSDIARAGPNAAAVSHVAKPFLSIPLAHFLQSPHKRHNCSCRQYQGSMAPVPGSSVGSAVSCRGMAYRGVPYSLYFYIGQSKLCGMRKNGFQLQLLLAFK